MARPKKKDKQKPKVWRTVNIEPNDDEKFKKIVKKTGKDRYIVFKEMLETCYPDICLSNT